MKSWRLGAANVECSILRDVLLYYKHVCHMTLKSMYYKCSLESTEEQNIIYYQTFTSLCIYQIDCYCATLKLKTLSI